MYDKSQLLTVQLPPYIQPLKFGCREAMNKRMKNILVNVKSVSLGDSVKELEVLSVSCIRVDVLLREEGGRGGGEGRREGGREGGGEGGER